MFYKTAPIQEAIFDIRIEKNIENSEFDEKIEKLSSLLVGQYPIRKTQMNFSGTLNFQSSELIDQSKTTELRGYLYSDKNNRKNIQLRKDGFTFNMLSPYTSWGDFSENAFKFWEFYKNAFPDVKIIRLGLRYINRINIPLPCVSFEEYISNMPPIPKNLPKVLNSFFTQIQVPASTQNTDFNVTVTQTIQKNNEQNIIPFIIDIDVFNQKVASQNTSDLRLIFSKMREIKNETFESSIQDKARVLFNN